MTKAKMLTNTAGSAFSLGALSTFGDWVWANYLTDGALLPALVHGVLFFVALSLVLGGLAGSWAATRRLLVTLPFAGLVIAGAFYPIARLVGYLPALLIAWFLMWIAMAALQGWAQRLRRPLTRELLVGAIAALGSGLAFWSISGIWTQPEAYSSYWLRLLAWTWAFAPGFLALLYRPSATEDPRGS